MKKRLSLFVVAPVLCVTVACTFSKSENPLSPTVAGPIPGVDISAPRALEPAAGAMIAGTSQPLTLLLENAFTNGQRPLNYVFEVATDAGFGSKVFERSGIQPGDGGRTSLRLPDALGSGRGYYWRAKAQDGANSGPYSSPAAFTVFTPVAFEKAVAVSPANNEKTATNAPQFSFTNAPRVGSPTSVGYVIEVSQSSSFSQLFAAWYVDEQPGTTRLTAPVGLPGDAQLFWRTRASDGGIVGPYSDAAVFRTPAPVVATPPSSGGGTSAPGTPCTNKATELDIVKCRRSQYGHMSNTDIIAFLRGIARDLNAGNFPDKSYGLLVKTSGNNCNGYSCDIICSTSTKIWDTLADSEGSQDPIWLTKGFNPDKCEVQ